MGPALEKLTKKDADLCRALRSVILKGKFEVQGEALAQVGALFRWLSDLDRRIEKTIEPPPPPLSIEDKTEKKAKK